MRDLAKRGVLFLAVSFALTIVVPPVEYGFRRMIGSPVILFIAGSRRRRVRRFFGKYLFII